MYRDSKNQIIGGVSGALSEKFGIRRSYIRLFFILGALSTVFAPFTILLYLILCVVIPRKEDNTKFASNLSTTSVKNFKADQNKVHSVVEQITKISSGILNKQKGNALVQRLIQEFKEKIVEFQKFSPELEKQYLSCIAYLNDKDNNAELLKHTINSLKEKVSSSSDSVRENYLNIIDQKEKRLKLLDEIKEYTEIIESKLYLILNTLQNIEASILHAELQTQVSDNNYDNLQSQISILTENMTEMSDIFRRNRIRL